MNDNAKPIDVDADVDVAQMTHFDPEPAERTFIWASELEIHERWLWETSEIEIPRAAPLQDHMKDGMRESAEILHLAIDNFGKQLYLDTTMLLRRWEAWYELTEQIHSASMEK